MNVVTSPSEGGDTVEKRYNFRIYPTEEQEAQIQKNFGCCRFVYNYYLIKRMDVYEKERRILGLNECGLDLTQLKKTEGYEWLMEADANALLAALKDLDLAFKAFFRRVKQGGAPGFPRFKRKRDQKKSYKSRKNTERSNIELADNHIKLTKLGWTRCKGSRPLEGRILSATVSQTRSGKYFVSLCCTETEPHPLPKTGADVGLHLGIRDLAATSDGERIENPRFFERSEEKIARLRRRLSRKPKDSQNREKARIKMARAYERVANQRNDFLNKLSTRLVRDYDRIYVKELKTAEVMKDRRFAKWIADAGWGGLMERLAYKCSWYGKTLILVNEMFPSAQTCSACGFVNPEVKGKSGLREWDCPACGAHHDRGVNAARNVLKEGTRLPAPGGAPGKAAAVEEKDKAEMAS
jgi:putative transposase